ncbi:MAG: WxcM-like domain-containing protein [Bacteroidia bacterium]
MHNFKLIEGGIFSDNRGKLFHVNEFDMSLVKRFYAVENNIENPTRAWQAHQKESKWFFVVKGSFLIGLVLPDNWESPSPNLHIEKIILGETDSKVLYIPPGYANGIKALEPNSKLMVFSNFTIQEAATDNIKFDINTWQL